MSIGAWEPGQSKPEVTLDLALVKDLLAIAKQASEDKLEAALSTEQQTQGAALMQLPNSAWIDAGAEFDNQDLISLMRFFTLAEQQLAGWEAGEKSPVIGLNKAYKKRGEKLDKDMLLWFRANSNNRFIPNGGL